MNENTGEIKVFPKDEKVPAGFSALSNDEMKQMEGMGDQVEQMIAAWNTYISKRKVSLLEKIKMRQAWIASWAEAAKSSTK